MNNTDEHLAKKKKKIVPKNKNRNLKNKKKHVNSENKKETSIKKNPSSKKNTLEKKKVTTQKKKESSTEKKKPTTKNRNQEIRDKKYPDHSQDSGKQKIKKQKKEFNTTNQKSQKSSNNVSKNHLKKKHSNPNATKKTAKKNSKKRKVQKQTNIIEMVKFIVPILLVLIVIVGFHLKTASHTVDGDSMNPTLLNGDRVIVTKGKEIERYEIITFEPPVESDFQYVKRVIGMPEDSIWITGNHLFINPKPNLKQSYSELIISFIDELPDGTLKLNISDKCAEQLEGLKNIPKGKYFVLGDNRENSSDSREFGLVDERSIEGAVSFRTGPISRFGLLK